MLPLQLLQQGQPGQPAGQQHQDEQQDDEEVEQDTQQEQRGTTRDTAPAAAWAASLPDMHDAWRRLHPARRGFTYTHTRSLSRIDRAYVSGALLPQVVTCRHADKAAPLSDHCPVMLQLRPSEPGAFGPGLARLRLSFLTDASCVQQFSAWLATQQPPAAQAALVSQWWPAFVAGLRSQIQALNRHARYNDRHQGPGAQREAARAAVYSAVQHARECSDAALPAALQQLMQARGTLTAVREADEDAARQHRREPWAGLHGGERPGPAMTRIIRPPKAAGYIAGLLHPAQATSCWTASAWPPSLAGVREVSAAVPLQQQARQAVLDAVTQHSHTLTAEQAAALGDSSITVAEVEAAVRAMAPGKAPGLDGIPGELYRRFSERLSPLLAALYSAIGATGLVPPGFLDGVVVPVLKPGAAATSVDSYRPLQMLNYSYRILAKVLANRLLEVAGGIIDPAQCAFLKDRAIGDSIRLLQFLPALLSGEQRAAVAAFVDFRKAYDTVDRRFLRGVAARLGCGAGFLSWMGVCCRAPTVVRWSTALSLLS